MMAEGKRQFPDVLCGSPSALVIVLPVAHATFGIFAGLALVVAAGAALDGHLPFLAVALEKRDFLIQF